MRNFTTVLYILLVYNMFTTSSIAQTGDDLEKIWSVIKLDPGTADNFDHYYKWYPAEPKLKHYEFDGSSITVEPNFRPFPGSNTTQSELSIDVHPLNNNVIFGSSNSTNWPVTQLYGTGVYWSSTGGVSWSGFNAPPFGSNSGDPASVIGTNGYMYEGYITNSSGQGIAVSTNGGVNWSTYTVAPNPGQIADKNHLMVDKQVGSPYENRVYDAWTDLGGGSNDNDVVIKYSTNFGQTWSNAVNLSSSLNAGSHSQGVNVQTGPNGEVYAVWAVYDNFPSGEDAIGFAKSTNGGVNWISARIYGALTPNGNFNFGIRGNIKPTSIRVSSFPSMAVDRSGGPNDGNIYITWPQRGVTPAGNDPDIVMIKSTDGGTTWSSPVRVNDDGLNNVRDQYFPWMTVDQETGHLHFVFYDSRETTNDSSGVYMARSVNGGVTFENYRVSDQNFRPKPIAGLAGGYQGDYIGIAALDEIAYPFWSDDRTGNYQAWISKVSFGPPCPVDPATNPNPVNGAVDISINLSQISWTNGAGASQCEVWFGEGASMSMVYSGSLISSWSIPSQLNYNAVYNWRVVEKNDTCSVSGPVWAFLTELSPGIVFIEPFDNLNCWSAIGPLGTTNWSVQSSNNAGGTPPELRLNWSPEFNGLSKLVSCSIPVNNNNNYTVEFRHMLDWYANPAPFIGLGVSYDNGATYTTIWQTQPTGDITAETISVSFLTPADNSSENINLNLVLYCNGNSFNIDFWYVDDLILNDDDFEATFPLTVSIENGWNIVSIPGLHPVDQNVDTWWAGKDPSAGVFQYNGGYQPVTTVEPGIGYWMKHLGNQVYNTGDEWPAGGMLFVPYDPIAGITGWNIIGGYDYNAATSGITTTPSGLQDGSVYGYSAGGGYYVADNLIPGYGYWIKLTGPGDINLPTPTFNGQSKIAGSLKEDWGKIIITDNAGKSSTLYSVNGKINLNEYELPPVPPTGMFDVRYSSRRFAEDISNGSQSIVMSGIEYPAKVRVENMSVRIQDETGREINEVLKSGEEVLINNSSINKLLVSGEMIPDEYSLEQNYPNPFNPVTNIKFSVPKQTQLKINLYNTLGELIQTITDRLYEPGYYQVTLNAQNLSSGLYIYRFESSEIVQTKKMILLK